MKCRGVREKSGTALKIIVISDTHVDSVEGLPRRVLDDLSGADMIIHAGDFTGKRLLDALRKIAPFRGVYGNIDGLEGGGQEGIARN